jgi:hypothetical protein
MKLADPSIDGPNNTLKDFLSRIGPITIVYILVTWFTNAWNMGDTVDYADSILAYHRGYNLMFWEFGHLFWRPLGWLVFRIGSPLTSLLYSGDDRAKVTFTILAINWICGLCCLLLLRALVQRVCNQPLIVTLTPIAFLFCSAFLNYGQTGSAYIPGLALVLTGALILVRDCERPGGKFASLFAAIALAGGISLWVPLVLIVPAALTLPIFLGHWNLRTLRSAILTSVLFACFVGLAYTAVVVNLGINNLQDLKEWITSASHGMNRMRGVPRMVFGFANSFIDLGGEGGLFKRYLKHDPFNPVRLSDLLWSSVYKLVFTYIFLFCVLINLLRSRRGKLLAALLLVDVLPTIIFALFVFEAGDMSRYVAALPLIFLAIGYAICSDESLRWTKFVIVGFILVSAVTNVRAMALPTLAQREQRVERRISPLLPLLKPGSRVVTSHLLDEVNNFTRDFLFNPINRSGALRYYAVVTLNTSQVDHWQQDFAKTVLDVWNDNGDVWVSKRLLSQTPKAEWNWVEGDDSRVSWKDLNNFFLQFDFEKETIEEDGFLLLSRSQRNQWIVNQLAQNSKQ